jgi:hypothetical protein
MLVSGAASKYAPLFQAGFAASAVTVKVSVPSVVITIVPTGTVTLKPGE